MSLSLLHEEQNGFQEIALFLMTPCDQHRALFVSCNIFNPICLYHANLLKYQLYSITCDAVKSGVEFQNVVLNRINNTLLNKV